MPHEQVLLESGQMVHTHDRNTCIGQWCAIHCPMPGPWATWPRSWDEEMLRVVRTCRCGVDHPVAEMYAWAVATGCEERLYHHCCHIHPCTPIDGGMG
jgi:hypothetical protein